MDRVKSDMNYEREGFSRRSFIRAAALGAAGAAFGAGAFAGRARALPKAPDTSRVSFITGNDRRDNIIRALAPFKDEIAKGIEDKQVVIKVNMAATYIPLTATHPDAVRGLLDFLAPMYKKKIIIAESTASDEGAQKLFDHYGYGPVRKEYNVDFTELNDQPTSPYLILGKNLEALKIPLIDTFTNPKNYLFSVTRPKSHNAVVITLGLKNTVMGAPLKVFKKISYKGMMHGRGPWWLHYNIYTVAQAVRPDFTVIDGFEGLEGDGPTKGEPVDHRIALVGPDVIAVDRIGVDLMGADIADVGYLNFCADAGLGNLDKAKIKILGSDDPAKFVRKYKMNKNIDWQMQWRKDLPVKPDPVYGVG
jgi:uncharacterized protein (DUF362 family)